MLRNQLAGDGKADFGIKIKVEKKEGTMLLDHSLAPMSL